MSGSDLWINMDTQHRSSVMTLSPFARLLLLENSGCKKVKREGEKEPLHPVNSTSSLFFCQHSTHFRHWLIYNASNLSV